MTAKRINQAILLVVGVGSIWAGIASGTWFVALGGVAFLVILISTLRNRDSN
jgi:TRAP-type mannitol/chloroaromatic compound transport system permease large subunit